MDQQNNEQVVHVEHSEWKEPVEFVPQNITINNGYEQQQTAQQSEQVTTAQVAGINVHISGSREYDATQGKGQYHQSSMAQKQVRSEGYAQVSGAIIPEYRPGQLGGEQHIDIVQSTSTISAQTQDAEIPVVPAELSQIDRAFYEQEIRRIAEEHERKVKLRTEAYRRETEVQAEKLRIELQKQHIQEQQYRRELSEAAIAREKQEALLAYRAKLTELERTQQALKSAADQARLSSEIEVTISTAAGETVTGISIDSKAESARIGIEANGAYGKSHEEVRTLGDKLKTIMLGRP